MKKNAVIPETVNDIQEIDFSEVNTLDFIEDTDTASLSSFNEEDDIDIPLENLLFNQCGATANNHQHHQCQKLHHIEESSCFNEPNNNNIFSNQVAGYSNYNNNCLTYAESEKIQPDQSRSLPCHSNAMESTANQYTMNNFTSLLVKSMLISDGLSIEQQPDNNEETFYEETSPVTIPTFSNPIKSEPVGQHFNSTPLYNNVDLTLNALKEFERIVMLNSLVEI